MKDKLTNKIDSFQKNEILAMHINSLIYSNKEILKKILISELNYLIKNEKKNIRDSVMDWIESTNKINKRGLLVNNMYIYKTDEDITYITLNNLKSLNIDLIKNYIDNELDVNKSYIKLSSISFNVDTNKYERLNEITCYTTTNLENKILDCLCNSVNYIILNDFKISDIDLKNKDIFYLHSIRSNIELRVKLIKILNSYNIKLSIEIGLKK